ncbi:MAG TPA: asparaginase [Bacillota bacterium]
MKTIAFINLGGTISATGNNRLDLKDYQSGSLSGSDFLNHLHELEQIANIHVIQMDNISSTQINEQHWIQLKEHIEFYLNEQQYDGIVITHGTSTMEETAYFLHLTVNSEKPIVLVGAQRPFTALSTDAHLNLIHAVRVAIDPKSCNKGVLIAHNDEIHCARDVTKTETYRLNTFHSGAMGSLGFIEPDGSIQYYRTPTRRHTTQSQFATQTIGQLPKVEIVYSYAGATGEWIHHIIETNTYAGIVIAGTGAGRFSKREEEALRKARKKGLHVVRSNRVGNGRVVDIDAYKTLHAISGDNLNPQKARILLMLSLSMYNNTEDIQKIFHDY